MRMSTPQPEIHSISIVLLGAFNPKIFQPAWFAFEELIRKQEAEEANIEIVHPDAVSFALEWLRLQVTRERFTASTTQEPLERSWDESLQRSDRIMSTLLEKQ